MKPTLVKTLVYFATLFLPCAEAQQTEALRKLFEEFQKFGELKARAKRGEAETQFEVGNCYFNGQAVAKDEKEAMNWWRKAAQQNHPRAQNNLGFCYDKGLAGF